MGRNHDKHELVPQEPVRGFPVGRPNEPVPPIGESGTVQQWCPLLKGACLKGGCMFWVELLTQNPEAPRVAHCAYYWNTIQLTDIKTALLQLNGSLVHLSQHLKELTHAPTA